MSSKYNKNLGGWVATLDEATGLPTKKMDWRDKN